MVEQDVQDSGRHEHPVAELWTQYKATGDVELRNRLVVQHSPLVRTRPDFTTSSTASSAMRL